MKDGPTSRCTGSAGNDARLPVTFALCMDERMRLSRKGIFLSLTVVAALILLGASVRYLPAQEPSSENERWPKTVKEAVATILAGMSEFDKDTVRKTAKEELINFHHGWGTGIRNDFGLWRGNRDLMNDTKARHPDDASMVIIGAVWEALQKE
jgi:hypothetical protein